MGQIRILQTIVSVIGYGCLEFVWDLGFGICNFRISHGEIRNYKNSW
jgi:hypothetical protein